MKAKVERGAASIRIDLYDGHISIVHGEGGDLLSFFPHVPEGTWDQMWQALRDALTAHTPDHICFIDDTTCDDCCAPGYGEEK